jgi:hypothetical protein
MKSKTMTDHDSCSAIRHLLQHLPDNFHGLWLDVNQLHNILKHGGFPLLPKSVVVKSLRGNRDTAFPQRNIINNRTYYQYGDTTTTNKPKCFKKQRDSGILIPEFVVGFYLQEGGIFFHDQVESLKRKGYCQEMTDGRASVQEETTPEQTATQSSEKVNKKPAGLKIVDIDVDDIFIEDIQGHTKKCHCPMHRVSQTKMGFDLKEYWKCNFCKWAIHRRSGKDANRLTPKRGPKPSELNITVTTAFLEAGVGVGKANEDEIIAEPASKPSRKGVLRDKGLLNIGHDECTLRI